MNYQKTTIVEMRRVASEYALLRFSGSLPMDGLPGQFVMIRGNWGSDPILPRAFSLVTSGDSGAVLVRDVGRGTSLLCNMREGDDLFVLGPLGTSFDISDPSRTAVLVAGGVGVAPLVFLANQLSTQSRRVVFLYGARSAADILLRQEIAAVAELRLTTEDGSLGQTGRVTEVLEMVLRQEECTVYSCGPHRMLETVGRMAADAGVPCQVALESPMACGMGTCKGCAVPDVDGNYKYVCSDGPVFAAQQIFGGVR